MQNWQQSVFLAYVNTSNEILTHSYHLHGYIFVYTIVISYKKRFEKTVILLCI